MSRLEHSQNNQGPPLVWDCVFVDASVATERKPSSLEQQPHTRWHTVTALFQHNYRLIPQMAHWCRQRPTRPSAQSKGVTGSGGVWKERNLTALLVFFFFLNKKDNNLLYLIKMSLSIWMPHPFSLYDLIVCSDRVFFFACLCSQFRFANGLWNSAVVQQ